MDLQRQRAPSFQNQFSGKYEFSGSQRPQKASTSVRKLRVFRFIETQELIIESRQGNGEITMYCTKTSEKCQQHQNGKGLTVETMSAIISLPFICVFSFVLPMTGSFLTSSIQMNTCAYKTYKTLDYWTIDQVTTKQQFIHAASGTSLWVLQRKKKTLDRFFFPTKQTDVRTSHDREKV